MTEQQHKQNKAVQYLAILPILQGFLTIVVSISRNILYKISTDEGLFAVCGHILTGATYDRILRRGTMMSQHENGMGAC